MRKQKVKRNLTRQQIFDYDSFEEKLTRPNPPTEEAIKRAQFVDRTYVWKQK